MAAAVAAGQGYQHFREQLVCIGRGFFRRCAFGVILTCWRLGTSAQRESSHAMHTSCFVRVLLARLLLSMWCAKLHCWETVQITDGLAVCVNSYLEWAEVVCMYMCMRRVFVGI